MFETSMVDLYRFCLHLVYRVNLADSMRENKIFKATQQTGVWGY